MTIEFNPCLCSLAEMLGDSKTLVSNFITTLIGLLQTLKATILLFAIDLEDEIRRRKYELELAAIQKVIDTVQAPFSMLMGYTRLLADCDPVASFAETLKETRDDVLGDLEERAYEVEQLIAAITAKRKKIDAIDKRIEMLEEIRDALELCG